MDPRSRSRSRLELHKATLLAVMHEATAWGIAVDVERRLFYWTQKGPSKGNAIPPGETPDNRSDKILLLHHLPEPIDLDLDLQANMMYMSDGGDKVSSSRGTETSTCNANGHTKPVWQLHSLAGLTSTVMTRLRRRFWRRDFTKLSDRNSRCISLICVEQSTLPRYLDGSDEKVLLPDVGDLTGMTSRSLEQPSD